MPYLDDWGASIASREGFTRAEKKRMLLSDETLLGLRMTGKSTYIETCIIMIMFTLQ